MKKSIFFLFFATHCLFAQKTDLNAIILDSATKLPIPNVSIYFDNENQNSLIGTVSNDEGKFTISTSVNKLLFSHINYESTTINLTPDVHEIYLTPKTYSLEELIVSNQDPKTYLASVINNSISSFDNNTEFKGYCRETVKIKDKLTKFADANINFYVKKGKRKSKSIVIEQSRAFFHPDIDLENTKDMESINSVYNVNDMIAEGYDLNYLMNLIETTKNVEFVRKMKKDKEGNEIEFVDIVPNPNVEKLLIAGYIIIDPNSKKLLEYQIHFSENHMKNAKEIDLIFLKAKPLKLLIWVKFKPFMGQNILTYYQKDVGIYMKYKKFDGNLAFKNELMIYQQNSPVELPAKSYKKSSLFEAGTNYTQEFWNDNNVFPLINEESLFVTTNGKIRK